MFRLLFWMWTDDADAPPVPDLEDARRMYFGRRFMGIGEY